jgi:hypothetical protein
MGPPTLTNSTSEFEVAINLKTAKVIGRANE